MKKLHAVDAFWRQRALDLQTMRAESMLYTQSLELDVDSLRRRNVTLSFVSVVLAILLFGVLCVAMAMTKGCGI